MTITTDIQSLYIAYFNRPADFLGLKYWVAQANANKGSVAAVANAFSASPEYINQFAGKATADIINTIYQNLFGRGAEPAAIEYWGKLYDNKVFNIGNIATSILSGAQNADKTTVANKVAAAEAFYNAMDTSAEIIGYDGAAANAVAKAWLVGITDKASLDAATTPAALNTVLASAADAHNSTGGTVFTLTAGADTVAGTAGNDTINALGVNAAGTAASTVTAFDVIDGGNGNDTLNIYTTGTENATLPATATVKNVENIHIFNTGAAAALADASKYQGVTALWQHNAAAAVTNLGAGTTAGFQDITAGALSVSATDATASVAFANVGEAATLAVGGTKLATVNVSGTRADTNADGTTAGLTLGVTAGTDVATITLNSSAKATLTITDTASTVKVSTVDLTGSTGAITFVGDADVATIKGGAGNDILTVAAATVIASTGVTAVTATVTGGAGNDTINVNTTGTGATTIDGGAGDDIVNIVGRGSDKLTVTLGDGVDTFTSAVAVNAGDSIDAGAGIDTLSLSLVGASNIGAFAGFELFDVAGLGAKTLDIDILATKNTVTEIVGSANSGGASILTNVGAGVGFRATGDMAGAGVVTLTQKVAGALTVTLDADETATADTTIDTATTSVVASNATTLKAVFDTAFKADIAAETAVGDNVATIALNGATATNLDVVSGGALSHNVLNYTDGFTGGKLATLNITGDRDLTLSVANGLKLLTIDASAHTGGLTVSTASLGDGGVIKLGSGVDSITVVAGGTSLESLSGFEKAAAVAVSTVAGDAAALTAAQADADTLFFGAATAVADSAGGVFTGGTIAKGVLTFIGAGPADLTAAIAIANAAAETAGETVAFEYLGNSYVFSQGAVTDTVIKLTGVVGITNLGEAAANLDHFFVV